jgi:hypothetical protein
MATSKVQPRVIPHPPDDHRHVDAAELTCLKHYGTIVTPGHLSSILDFSMTNPTQFLKSTSNWNETHLIAFKSILLENLPMTRIVPAHHLPDDNDPTMLLVEKHLSDSEDDIHLGKSIELFGPATLIY